MDNNTVTIAEIKRRGMAAIEDGLRRGPLHIVKRNQWPQHPRSMKSMALSTSS